MSEMKPTPGPLRVQADDKWPFYIRTYDAAGDCVFREDMPTYSTAQRNLAECLAGKHMSGDKEAAVRACAVAMANAELRAEAHNALTETRLSPRQLVEMNAELVEALVTAQQMINSMKAEAETAAQGDEQMMLEACENISNEGLQADMDIRAALTKASASSISKGVE